jgi:hypothetical protein
MIEPAEKLEVLAQSFDEIGVTMTTYALASLGMKQEAITALYYESYNRRDYIPESKIKAPLPNKGVVKTLVEYITEKNQYRLKDPLGMRRHEIEVYLNVLQSASFDWMRFANGGRVQTGWTAEEIDREATAYKTALTEKSGIRLMGGKLRFARASDHLMEVQTLMAKGKMHEARLHTVRGSIGETNVLIWMSFVPDSIDYYSSRKV